MHSENITQENSQNNTQKNFICKTAPQIFEDFGEVSDCQKFSCSVCGGEHCEHESMTCTLCGSLTCFKSSCVRSDHLNVCRNCHTCKCEKKCEYDN